ncbi:RES family NAD+ phosphorylase [Parafilimonas sp.]|uniref:RES family NAD+ phosphorylase n=1 Tax=Parafilimonas sp. TaxID=1969739 RepID=UPI0039E52D1A
MLVYRISRAKFANDLTGEGARLFGGRWNNKLTPCIYTSESRALALLEYTVNINIDDVPRALSIITLEIPGKNMLIVKEEELPGDWKSIPAPSSTKKFGTKLLSAAKAPVIKIPSTVIHEEFNYLLNPRHADSGDFKVVEIKDFVYDMRIKLN